MSAIFLMVLSFAWTWTLDLIMGSLELYLSAHTFGKPEAVFLVLCDPSVNELWATQTGLCIDLYWSRSLTAHL